ncbi:lipid transporter atnI [Penicillium diatomitis]|uniref:Lipid transporter atnI n=1 Tax=Penicillium diatomitis TaxID=2819901 RepID=A0A9W9X7K8_9EURO|nr:lipid transporter atnI [Penicillium diatomitis]KAJ5485554.1 lipid transporter atnI [Penicillium diatomitis]
MASSSTTTTGSSTLATATCLHVPPGKNGYLPPESCDVVLYYVPSFAAAVLFCVLFGMSTLLHCVQSLIYKRTYMWVLIMGGAWEVLAFVFRTLQTRHQNNGDWDTLFTLFFLLAPIWINAFLYMTLGRMIYFFLPEKNLHGISARRFGTIFVWLDIVAFLVQAAGAILAGNQDSDTGSLITTGLNIYMGGIGLQEAFILCFLILAIKLHRRMLRLERSADEPNERLTKTPLNWRWLFYGLYFCLEMITIRIIFRISQYAQGTSPGSPVLTTEAYEYVLDAVPMFLAMLVLNVIHPGRILQGPESGFSAIRRAEKQAKKDKNEERKNAKEDERMVKYMAKEDKKRRKGETKASPTESSTRPAMV